MELGERTGAAQAARARQRADGHGLRGVATRDLVGEVARKASELVKKEIELAKAEVKADVRAEVRMAAGLGVAAVCAILFLAMLLVAAAFGLAAAGLPPWAAALIVAAAVGVVGGVAAAWGWAKRVRRPLETTRRSLEENVRWAKERLA
ncbi:MAG: phage holin family protein [Anaeromyxobacteraceae bacterium]